MSGSFKSGFDSSLDSDSNFIAVYSDSPNWCEQKFMNLLGASPFLSRLICCCIFYVCKGELTVIAYNTGINQRSLKFLISL